MHGPLDDAQILSGPNDRCWIVCVFPHGKLIQFVTFEVIVPDPGSRSNSGHGRTELRRVLQLRPQIRAERDRALRDRALRGRASRIHALAAWVDRSIVSSNGDMIFSKEPLSLLHWLIEEASRRATDQPGSFLSRLDSKTNAEATREH